MKISSVFFSSGMRCSVRIKRVCDVMWSFCTSIRMWNDEFPIFFISLFYFAHLFQVMCVCLISRHMYSAVWSKALNVRIECSILDSERQTLLYCIYYICFVARMNCSFGCFFRTVWCMPVSTSLSAVAHQPVSQCLYETLEK